MKFWFLQKVLVYTFKEKDLALIKFSRHGIQTQFWKEDLSF